MKLRDVLRIANEAAPFALAQEWDNVGLMVGDLDAEVRRAGIALDAVSEAVIRADECGCQVLISHHPLLFRPIKKLDLRSDPGRAVREAVKRDVSVLALHTNWDCAAWGVNAELARLLGLENASPLDAGTGLGSIGDLPEAMPLNDLLLRAKDVWGLSRIDCYSPDSGDVRRVALCGGSGSEFWPAAMAQGADIYLTADMKYHELMDAGRAGLTVALSDHGEMERATMPALAARLNDAAGGKVEFILLDVRALTVPIHL